MLYEYAVLSVIGGDDGNGSGILLTYGETESPAKLDALKDHYRQFGGYVVYKSSINYDLYD